MLFYFVSRVVVIVSASCKRRDILRDNQILEVMKLLDIGELSSGTCLNQETNLMRADYTENLPLAQCGRLRRETVNSENYYQELLDNLHANEANFDPYKTRKRVVPDIAFYTGPIHYMDMVEPYLPDRMLRQFGLQQVGRGQALVRGHGREEQVLTVLEVVDRAVANTKLGAMALRATLKEVQAILQLKATVYSR
ncbi:hypothetical protein RHMOL_Rhmol06G0158100 [Rhododendron molle]|uniref:Uncharacterized protein n=1 Tax=Rhododendron molle TaxID=49168 RepID=A0ACC0NF32_RHOML|nr:hypothetical protein RHMOL_Rhmol06G0158100 [Rhododendron molle]